MNYIKKHIKLIIALIVILIIAIAAFIGIKKLMPDTRISVWGNRTADNGKHPINGDDIDKIIEELKKEESVSDVTYRLSGRKMNFMIIVNEGTTRATAEGLTKHILGNLSDDIKEYYDIELYYKSLNSEDTVFPFMGYKNKISSSFSFTNAG